MICFVVVESQKGWNGLRNDRAPTFRPNCMKIGVLHIPLASDRHTFKGHRLSILESSHYHELYLRQGEILTILVFPIFCLVTELEP